MSLVPCTTLYGETKLIPQSSFVFRPTVYAIILRNEQVLLITTRHTGKDYFPGGGVEVGERFEAALRREVREETGLEINIRKLLHVEEHFFFHDPSAEAWHCLLLFFLCTTHTDILPQASIDDGEVAAVQWVSRQTLRIEDFPPDASNVVLMLQRLVVPPVDN